MSNYKNKDEEPFINDLEELSQNKQEHILYIEENWRIVENIVGEIELPELDTLSWSYTQDLKLAIDMVKHQGFIESSSQAKNYLLNPQQLHQKFPINRELQIMDLKNLIYSTKLSQKEEEAIKNLCSSNTPANIYERLKIGDKETLEEESVTFIMNILGCLEINYVLPQENRKTDHGIMNNERIVCIPDGYMDLINKIIPIEVKRPYDSYYQSKISKSPHVTAMNFAFNQNITQMQVQAARNPFTRTQYGFCFTAHEYSINQMIIEEGEKLPNQRLPNNKNGKKYVDVPEMRGKVKFAYIKKPFYKPDEGKLCHESFRFLVKGVKAIFRKK